MAKLIIVNNESGAKPNGDKFELFQVMEEATDENKFPETLVKITLEAKEDDSAVLKKVTKLIQTNLKKQL